MNWGSKLQKQKSTNCSNSLAMDVQNWCASRCTSMRYMASDSDEFAALNNMSGHNRSSMPRWRLFWRRLKKEKRRIFDCSSPVQVPYDPYTYSQNFDQGAAWTEPDNLSRSFSARFADPSRIFQRNATVVS